MEERGESLMRLAISADVGESGLDCSTTGVNEGIIPFRKKSSNWVPSNWACPPNSWFEDGDSAGLAKKSICASSEEDGSRNEVYDGLDASNWNPDGEVTGWSSADGKKADGEKANDGGEGADWAPSVWFRNDEGEDEYPPIDISRIGCWGRSGAGESELDLDEVPGTLRSFGLGAEKALKPDEENECWGGVSGLLTVLNRLEGESPDEAVLGETELWYELLDEADEMYDFGESASFSPREDGGEGGLTAFTGTLVPVPPTLSANENVNADCLSWRRGGNEHSARESQPRWQA